MRVFQSTYKNKEGRTRTTERGYIEFRDHLEMPRRVPGFTDRKATASLARNIQRLAWCKPNGKTVDPVLTKWVEGLSPPCPVLAVDPLRAGAYLDPRTGWPAPPRPGKRQQGSPRGPLSGCRGRPAAAGYARSSEG
jgi:hypothetical protein